MKTFILLTIMFILMGCDNSSNDVSVEDNGFQDVEDKENYTHSSEASNLVNSENVENGKWIGQAGSIEANERMILTESIKYNSSSTYIMNKTSYVTYQQGDEILKTILHSEGSPEIILETVQNADNIRISMDENKLDDFLLYEN